MDTIKSVMLGNFDEYTPEFVDWVSLCSRQGEVHVILMDNSFGAQRSTVDRAKLCHSNKHVVDVITPVSGRWQKLIFDIGPDYLFVEPGFTDAIEVERWAEENGIVVLKTQFHWKPRQRFFLD